MKAMRAMTGARYNDPSSPLFKRLNILKLKDLFEQVKLFMFDTALTQTPKGEHWVDAPCMHV